MEANSVIDSPDVSTASDSPPAKPTKPKGTLLKDGVVLADPVDVDFSPKRWCGRFTCRSPQRIASDTVLTLRMDDGESARIRIRTANLGSDPKHDDYVVTATFIEAKG